MKKKKVVTIGGGTGSFVLLKGLKHYNLDLSAVVCVTDSGGSTGRLRSEFGFLPVGDFRQCLAALAKDEQQEYIRKLLLYRFSQGRGLKGHNLGNLILTALTDMVGSEQKAINLASKIFQLQGNVLPVSLDDVDLVVEYADGTIIKGEHQIDQPDHGGGKKIVHLSTDPQAEIYSATEKAILSADLIVLGPGDVFTSILPNLVVQGVKQAMSRSSAKIVYVVNLMTRYSQTPGYTAADHLQEIEKYLEKKPDYLLVNSQPVPKNILEKYEQEQSRPVENDLQTEEYQVISKSLLKEQPVKKKQGDVLKRSFLRHDSQKLAESIVQLLKDNG